MGDSFLNLDLNQQSAVDPDGIGIFLHNHETPQRPIEDRIMFAIRVSARHHETSMTSAIEPTGLVKNHKRDITHLAKALEMDLDGNKIDDCDNNNDNGHNDNGVVFDCNICLDMAKDPILTCCGHLFCWGCFYRVPYVDSVSKECPVCNGEVIDASVTPVYGNGNSLQELELRYGVKIPPRPQARRVESVGSRSLLYNSVVHASVSIPSEAQRIDVGVSSSRRRRRRRVT